MSDKAPGNWSLINFKGFLLSYRDCSDYLKGMYCLGMLLNSSDWSWGRRYFQDICRTVLGTPLSNISRWTSICQHKLNWRLWGCKQLSASCQQWSSCPWYKPLVDKEKVNGVLSCHSPETSLLFSNSVFPDRRLRIEISYIGHMNTFGGKSRYFQGA